MQSILNAITFTSMIAGAFAHIRIVGNITNCRDSTESLESNVVSCSICSNMCTETGISGGLNIQDDQTYIDSTSTDIQDGNNLDNSQINYLLNLNGLDRDHMVYTSLGLGTDISVQSGLQWSSPSLTVNMQDSFGDGWNGYKLFINYANDTTFRELSLSEGSSETETFDIPPGTYNIIVKGNNMEGESLWTGSEYVDVDAFWADEVSWSITYNDAVILEGDAGCDGNAAIFNLNPDQDDCLTDDDSCCQNYFPSEMHNVFDDTLVVGQPVFNVLHAGDDDEQGDSSPLPKLLFFETHGTTPAQVWLYLPQYFYLEKVADVDSCPYEQNNYQDLQCSNNFNSLCLTTQSIIFNTCEVCSDGGCMDSTACNYDSAATYNDGTCDFSCRGCMDSTACNYDSAATEDGTCVFAIGCETCSGDTDGTGTVVDNDQDNDGVCDANEVVGCTDVDACDYIFVLNMDHDATLCDFSCYGCMDSNACNYDNTKTHPLESSCVFATGCETCSGETDGSGTVVDNDTDDDEVCNANEVVGCQDNTACDYNSDSTEDGTCVFATGCETCSGATDGTGTVVDHDQDNDGVCDDDEVPGCTNSIAENYNATATEEDDSCVIRGCMNNAANNYDATATDEYDPSTCVIPGCMYDWASNYNASATIDDGSCTVGNTVVEGCPNPTACNHDTASIGSDTSSCVYQNETMVNGCQVSYCNRTTYVDSNNFKTDHGGNVVEGDADNDDICWTNEVAGCQDNNACNYNSAATDDGEACTYAVTHYDCDGDCLNDADGDTVCDEFEVAGCQDNTACNYNSAATDDGEACTYADAGYDCDGDCLNDTDGDGVCDEFEVAGCQDNTACNYNSAATDDNDSCTYAVTHYDCDGDCITDTDGDGTCDEFEVAGCQDNTACNYNAAATEDDGSCKIPNNCAGCKGNTTDGSGDIDDDGVMSFFNVPDCCQDGNEPGISGDFPNFSCNALPTTSGNILLVDVSELEKYFEDRGKAIVPKWKGTVPSGTDFLPAYIVTAETNVWFDTNYTVVSGTPKAAYLIISPQYELSDGGLVLVKCNTLTSESTPPLGDVCTGGDYTGALRGDAATTDCAGTACGADDAATCCATTSPM